MSSLCTRLICLSAGAVICWSGLLVRAMDETLTNLSSSPPALNRALHTLPQRPLKSPVESFRNLLAMSPAEREVFLTNYPAATREKILAKVEEYSLLPPDYRELRLQVTELRWYLIPMLKTSPANRAAQLQRIPEPYQKLIAARLEEWDIWPPLLKNEVLEYETTLSRFVGRNAEGTPVVQPQMSIEDLPERDRFKAEQKLARWRELSPAERGQMYGSFQHFFDLSEEEKQRTLDALSVSDRQEAETVLNPIGKKPKPEQEQYLEALRQFNEMSQPERDQFMKNAARWQHMSPAERQAWRDLVKQLSEMPPLPPDFVLPRAQPIGPPPSAGDSGPTTVVPK